MLKHHGRHHQVSSAEAPQKGSRDSIKTIGPRIISLAKSEWKLLSLGFIGLVCGSAINLLFPELIRSVLNGSFGLNITEDLNLICSGLVLLFALQGVFFYIRHYCFQAAGYKVVAGVRKNLFRSLLEQEIGFFDSARLGDLLSRLSSDTELLQRAATANVSIAVRYFLQVIGGLVLMFLISPSLTGVVILVVPVIVISSIFWGKKLKNLSRAMQMHLGSASAAAEETLGGIRTVSIYNGKHSESERYGSSIENALTQGLGRSNIAAVFSSSMSFVVNASIALVLWYGGSLVIDNSLNIGDLTAFILYCVIVAVSFGFLAGVWEEFMQAVGAGERVFEIIDREPIVSSPVQAETLPQRNAGSVEFEDVSFHYPSRPELTVIQNVSFSIKPGQTVALVGPSGGGKSTIAALIPRFYDPDLGLIRYCGIDLKKLSLDDLRADISMVAQDPQVFSVSLRDNIAYGKESATTEEIEKAAQVANIDAFIKTLPQGYDTLVGDRGIQLSGGQRQRIAIARAVLKNPKFLILDEATSSLDSENEQLVQEALERLMKERTTLVIAHRLSTVQHSDEVLVIENGSIAQRGTHHSLVQEEGIYKTFVEHQLLEGNQEERI